MRSIFDSPYVDIDRVRFYISNARISAACISALTNRKIKNGPIDVFDRAVCGLRGWGGLLLYHAITSAADIASAQLAERADNHGENATLAIWSYGDIAYLQVAVGRSRAILTEPGVHGIHRAIGIGRGILAVKEENAGIRRRKFHRHFSYPFNQYWAPFRFDNVKLALPDSIHKAVYG